MEGLSTGYTMRDPPVDSVRLLRVVGFCVFSGSCVVSGPSGFCVSPGRYLFTRCHDNSKYG